VNTVTTSSWSHPLLHSGSVSSTTPSALQLDDHPGLACRTRSRQPTRDRRTSRPDGHRALGALISGNPQEHLSACVRVLPTRPNQRADHRYQKPSRLRPVDGSAPTPARRRSAPRGSSCGLVARSANAHVTSSWPSAPLPLDSVPVPLFVWDASLGLDDSVGWTSVTQRCVCCERARRCGVGRPVGAYRERHANRPGASPRTRSATRPAPPTPTRARSW